MKVKQMEYDDAKRDRCQPTLPSLPRLRPLDELGAPTE
jgi:hypothetical protein